MIRFLRSILAFTCIALGSSPVPAKEHSLASLPEGDYVLAMVYTGGVNATVLPYKGRGGLPSVRLLYDAVKEQMDKDFPAASAVLLLDVGDGFWGSAEALVTKGYAPVRMYNAARYDAVMLGNLDVANPALDALEIPLIDGNSDFYKKYPKVPEAVPGVLLERGPFKIGVMGALFTAPKEKDPYQFHRAEAARLRAAGAHLLILMAHDADRDWNEYKKMGVDIILFQATNNQLGDNPRQAIEEFTNKYGIAFAPVFGANKGTTTGVILAAFRARDGQLQIKLRAGQMKFPKNAPHDTHMMDVARSIERELSEKLDVQIGESAGKFSWALGHPTQAGMLIVEALREKSGAQVAILNTSGIRDGLDTGPIRKKHLVGMMPFGNRIATLDVSGEILLKIRNWRASSGAEPVLWAATTEIDTHATYRVATIDYLVEAGSSSKPWSYLRDAKNLHISGDLLEAVEEYIQIRRVLDPDKFRP